MKGFIEVRDRASREWMLININHIHSVVNKNFGGPNFAPVIITVQANAVKQIEVVGDYEAIKTFIQSGSR